MKKFLALFLALIAVLSVSLVACGGDGDNGDVTTTEPPLFYTGDATTTPPNNGDVTTTDPIDLNWIDDGNKVYIYDCYQCNIRTSNNTSSSSNIAGTVNFGEEYVRVKYNSQWSVILVNDQERYIKTDYVTSDPGYVVYTDKEATVYVTAEETLNLRWCYFGDDDDIAAIVKRGAALTQTGVSQNGDWIRVTFEGKTLYCSARYVDVTPPADGDETTDAPSSIVTPPPAG